MLQRYKEIITLEESIIMVFNKGNLQGFKGCILTGGQICAIKREKFTKIFWLICDNGNYFGFFRKIPR